MVRATAAGTAEAEAGALLGIGAMRSGPTVATAGSMMKGITIMRAVAGDTGATALDIGGGGATLEAEVLEEGGSAVQLEIVAKRGVLELSNGTGRRNRKRILARLILKKIMVATFRMVVVNINSMSNSSMTKDMDTELLMLLWFLECAAGSWFDDLFNKQFRVKPLLACLFLVMAGYLKWLFIFLAY